MQLAHTFQREDVPPHLIKYMGSKANIIDFIVDNINKINCDGSRKVYDLFAGTCIVSAHLNRSYEVVINDVQEYSTVLGKSYLKKVKKNDINVDIFVEQVEQYVAFFKKKYDVDFCYGANISRDDYLEIEQSERQLLLKKFNKKDNHLFVQNYSGTYWSFQQCLYIDSIYRIAQQYRSTTVYELILSSLMFAMSYSSPSTGHFAQYRDVKDDKNFKDILLYRVKSVIELFLSKLNQLLNYNRADNKPFESFTLSFDELLEKSDENSIIYADPPYGSVHYSRFYHVLETLVKYDYPEVKFKGRYRQDRHQSPFCKKSEASNAFEKMFSLIKEKGSAMVLSYSDAGVIELNSLLALAQNTFGESYDVSIQTMEYLHSRLGRTGGKNINVNEILIIANKV
ncbi:DNA adenine methylase [Acinetobacter sp. WCHAc010052]|uniref:DNA adenine methylase n=1 Tax=Acinetobacter sp. WCHAc010052 TaxID=2004647 RepID=UPI00148DCD48|nr:DNA adenine methylase [Acinetobacter sp. WCHAc010052]